jgi:hypothetical protein
VLEEFEQWVQDLEGVEDRSETADHGDPDNYNNPDEEDQRASDNERQLVQYLLDEAFWHSLSGEEIQGEL